MHYEKCARLSVDINSNHIFYNEILRIHTDTNECLPDSCQNNGTCTDLVNDYQCDCFAGFNGTNCEISKQFKCMLFLKM